jgi:hypothetical protein
LTGNFRAENRSLIGQYRAVDLLKMSAEGGPSFQRLGMLSRYAAPSRNDNHGAYPSDSTKKKYDKMTWRFAQAGLIPDRCRSRPKHWGLGTM